MLLAQGDMHVTHYIWTKHRDIIGDGRLGFEQVVDQAIRLRDEGAIRYLFLLGDLFDTINPHTSLIAFVRKQLERCQEANLPVYYIDGNHDKRTTPWLEAIHDWPQYVGDGKPFHPTGCPVMAALDYNDATTVEDWCAQLDSEVEVIFLHQQCRQYMDIPGMWDFDLAWVPTTVKRVIMGHVHEPWTHEFGDDQIAYYTGSTHLRAIDQQHPKSALLLRKNLEVDRVTLQERYIRHYNVASAEDLQPITSELDAVTSHVLPPVIRLYFIHEMKDAVDQLVTELQAKPCSPIVITKSVTTFEKPAAIIKPGQLTSAISPSEVLSEIVNNDEEPIVFRTVLGLLDESTPQQTTIEHAYIAFKKEHACK